jgi:predicted GIY-YIG superfamily endonuclease
MAFCYILRCADASFYVGFTHDVAERLTNHAEGSCSHCTADRSPSIKWLGPRAKKEASNRRWRWSP